VTEADCSIRYSGYPGNVVPPALSAATPAIFGPVVLNTLVASRTFTIPVHVDTPLQCKDPAMATIWFKGPLTGNVLT